MSPRLLLSPVAVVLLVWVAGSGCNIAGPKYNRYPGTATITRVEKTEAANANKGKADEGYEVWYTFVPKEEVKEDLGKNYLARFKEHQFTIGYSGMCPGPKFLKKYDMKPGKQFVCTLLVETQGTATPVILQFDDVPADLFEAAPAQADAPADGSVPFEAHDGYFVSNQFEPDAPTSFQILSDKAAFENVFKPAPVMREKVSRLAPDAFEKKMVLAVVHRGGAIVEYKVQSVKAEGTILTVNYTTHSPEKSDSAKFASPLIISIDQRNCTAVRFVEDGKEIKKVERREEKK